jgi:carnitine O-acetyltransferase
VVIPGGQVVHFENYGKDVIKKHKVSPDAWVQMVKQLAYGKMTGGKPAVTYESAQTRKFRLGRTEVIRSASNQSKAFVDAMLDPNGSVSPRRFLRIRVYRHTPADEQTPRHAHGQDVERAKLFRTAAARHIQYATWAADGQGVDRHMFGLKKLLREGEEMPEVFKDEAFALSSTWTLSTSNLTSEYLDNWG